MIDLDNTIVVCAGRASLKGVREEPSHVMDKETKRTMCGRDASDWVKIDGIAVDDAINSPFFCVRCAKRIGVEK